MTEEIIANVEKEISESLSDNDMKRVEELIRRGFDSKSIAQTLTVYKR